MTYQTEQRDPRREHECGKERGDDCWGHFLLGTEDGNDWRLGVEGRFVGVGRGRRGCGDVEVEEVYCRWIIYE